MRYAVGIDVGGTNTRVALIDEQYHIVERVQFSTNTTDPYAVIQRLCDEIKNFNKEICGIGMSCPGPLDLLQGKILETPNLQGKWWGFPIAEELQKACKVQVFLENDANLAALAEAVIGEGKKYRYVHFLTISTGIGSGQVIDQNIYIGAHGFASEIAHMCMWKDGPSHGSIYPGGIEAISSGTAIVNRAKEAGLDVVHAGDVHQLALSGNEIAKTIMEEAKVYLANAIAAIIALTDPEIVVLGGSVALKIDGFVKEVEELVKERVYRSVKPFVRIEKSTLDEDGGLLGAACLVFRKVQ